MSSALLNFGCLDELTQVIYQSFYKFVVLSSVSDHEWTVHVGLAGSEGRWWRGSWKEEDVLHFSGSKSTDPAMLEPFAEKLADVFIKGEMSIGDWSPDKCAEIKFTLGPNTQRPVRISLTELSAMDSAAYATSVFIDIALQAQSRKCKLYPSASDYAPSLLSYTPRSLITTSHQDQNEPPPPKRKETRTQPQSMVNPTNVTLAQASERVVTNSRKDGSSTATSAPAATLRAQKGASLANPNKKARKYQAIEFGSDEE